MLFEYKDNGNCCILRRGLNDVLLEESSADTRWRCKPRKALIEAIDFRCNLMFLARPDGSRVYMRTALWLWGTWK
jgi:hypothetical protein